MACERQRVRIPSGPNRKKSPSVVAEIFYVLDLTGFEPVAFRMPCERSTD